MCIAVVDLPDPPFSLPRTMTWAENGFLTSACINMERNLCVAIRSPACNGQNQEYSIRNDKLIVNHKGVTNAPCLCLVGNPMSSRSSRPARSKSRRPQIIHSLPTLARTLALWRSRHERIGLVPTMGALHAGHLT